MVRLRQVIVWDWHSFHQQDYQESCRQIFTKFWEGVCLSNTRNLLNFVTDLVRAQYENCLQHVRAIYCTSVLHTHTHTHARTHTHPFNGPFSGNTQVSRYQKGKTNLDFTGARDSEWQWHQLGHTQVCTSLQADNHASTTLLSFLQAGCPSCRPTNSVKALKAVLLY